MSRGSRTRRPTSTSSSTTSRWRSGRPPGPPTPRRPGNGRSAEHTSELQSLMRTSYAVFCLKNKKKNETNIIQATEPPIKRLNYKKSTPTLHNKATEYKVTHTLKEAKKN